MTGSGLKAIAQKHGKNALIVIGFDNTESTYFVGDILFDPNAICMMGDEECIKTKSFILNKETGKYDIPVTVYKPTGTIQAVWVLDNPTDRDKLRASDIYMR